MNHKKDLRNVLSTLKLPYLGKDAKVMESSVRSTVDKTFKAVELRISHVTRKPLNGNYKDVRYDQ